MALEGCWTVGTVPVTFLRRCPLPGGAVYLTGERATLPDELALALAESVPPYVSLDAQAATLKMTTQAPRDKMVARATHAKGDA